MLSKEIKPGQKILYFEIPIFRESPLLHSLGKKIFTDVFILAISLGNFTNLPVAQYNGNRRLTTALFFYKFLSGTKCRKIRLSEHNLM